MALTVRSKSMVRFPHSRSSGLIRRGAYGIALSVHVLAFPALSRSVSQGTQGEQARSNAEDFRPIEGVKPNMEFETDPIYLAQLEEKSSLKEDSENSSEEKE